MSNIYKMLFKFNSHHIGLIPSEMVHIRLLTYPWKDFSYFAVAITHLLVVSYMMTKEFADTQFNYKLRTRRLIF